MNASSLAAATAVLVLLFLALRLALQFVAGLFERGSRRRRR